MIEDLKKDLDKISNHEKAMTCKRFFKTGPGEYGEGDRFIGATMPEMRIIAKRYADMPIDQAMELLDSGVHEHRMTGLIMLVNKFLKSAGDRQRIYELYLSKTSRINNWDLVDVTCHHIVGKFLMDKDRSVLYKLARSKS
ncbi:MAG: DNA alkylation repair protein, partial [Candidatus Aenigmatarchaeota archaeon]